MYTVVAANKKYSEDEIRDRLATVYPEWEVEAAEFNEDLGWTIRLYKSAEFPFEKDKEDSDDDTSDSEDSAADSSSDSKEDSDDDDEPSDDKDSDELDSTEDLEDAKQDLVKELNDVIQQAQKTLEDLGSKAQEVADDASAKDDKIKEIADTVNDLGASPADELGDMPLGDEPLGSPMDEPMTPGAPGMDPTKRKRPAPRPPASRKRPPSGVRPPGINAFTKRQTEVVTHPGTDHLGKRISILAAAQALENSDEFKDYEIVSMTTNHDGTFSAKLKIKN